MKRTVLIIVAFLTISSVTYCIERENPSKENRKTTCVTGKITDKESGESLAGVAVRLSGLNQVVYSDLDGKFEIKDILPGTYKIETEFISYKQTKSEIKLDKKSENNIKLELESL